MGATSRTECQRLQRVRGQYRGCLVELAVQRRFAATDVIIVHRWQIIVHQGERVDELNSCCGRIE